MSEAKVKTLFATDVENPFQIDPALAEAPDIDLIGAVASASDLIRLARQHRPDVIVLDYDMVDLDAADSTRAILRENDHVQVIMVSVVGDAEDIRHAMRAGARDYLTKPLAEGELVETIRWLMRERREYVRMQSFVKQLRKAYQALFTDDKPVPDKVVAFLEQQAAEHPEDRLAQETLAVAYARNRDWGRLLPLVQRLAGE
ncbi:MAG: hypothetical protein Kow00124_20890 [Anaerolineae bacterium]